MRLYSTAFLMASAAVTMTACFQTATGPNSTSGLAEGSGANAGNTTTSTGVTVIPPTTPAGEQEFVDKVYPELDKSCTQCHATGTLGAPRFLSGATPHDVYYNVHFYRDGALIEPASTNLILNKGKHEGPDLIGPQRSVLEKWLVTENKDFDPQTKPQNFFDTLTNFASCMDFNQFKVEQLDQIFKLPVRAGGATCQTCHDVNHVEQSGDILLNNNAQDVFNGLKIFPGVLKLVSAVISSSGAFDRLEASDRLRLKGTEFNNCSAQVAIKLNFNVNDPNYCHPDYDFPQNLQDNLRFFVENTLQASRNGLCQNQKP